jgi:hypothetical protein
VNYAEGRQLIRASSSFEGCKPVAIADMLVAAIAEGVVREADEDDVRVAACAAYEIAKLGGSRELLWQLIGV